MEGVNTLKDSRMKRAETQLAFCTKVAENLYEPSTTNLNFDSKRLWRNHMMVLEWTKDH